MEEYDIQTRASERNPPHKKKRTDLPSDTANLAACDADSGRFQLVRGEKLKWRACFSCSLRIL